MRKTAYFFALTLFVVTLSAQMPTDSPAPAAENTNRVNRSWVGNSTDWFNPANWYPAGVPTASDNVEILSGETYYPLIDNTSPTCSNLTIHGGASLTMRRGVLNVMGDFYVEGTYHASNSLEWYQVVVNVWGHLTFREYSTATISTAGSHDINLYGYFSVWNGANVHWNKGNLNLLGDGNWLFQIANASGCYVNHLNIQKSAGAFAYLTQNLTLKGNLTILSGSFDSSGYNIYIGGNWLNQVGPPAFVENTGTVTFNGATDQYLPYSEDFYTLVVDKSGGMLILDNETYQIVVNCTYYDWIAGTLKVDSAWFSTENLSAGYIEGNWIVSGVALLTCYDASADLAGSLEVNGGLVVIYADNNTTSNWPRNGAPFTPASVTMTSGCIEIWNSLNIWSADVYPGFTENITGGIIKIHVNFAFASNFTPTGGDVEVVSSQAATVHANGGVLHGFTANSDGGVTLMTDLQCNGDVNVWQGLDVNYAQLTCLGDVNVNMNGTLDMAGPSTLRMTGGHSVNVNTGGLLELHGNEIGMPKITRYLAADRYGVNILSGGTIRAGWAIFEYLGMNGVNVMPNATVDPNFSFNNCIFRYGTDFGVLLTLDNSDNLLIDSATFIAGEAMGNVKKTVDAGVVNLVNAVGTFAGEEHDFDVFERVIWTAPTAATDLRIIKATFESAYAYPGDWIRVKVTMVNASTTPSSIPYWLYLYFDRDTPPHVFLNGDTWVRDYVARGGMPYDFTFEFYLWDTVWAGPWTSWLQIDGENEVAESDETNNLYGPINTFEFRALPQITDLTIERVPATGSVRLDWTYPVPVTLFKIYRSNSPEGPYTWDDWTMATEYLGHTSDPYKFYKVTAERIPPSP